MEYYTSGERFHSSRRCRLLHRTRGRVRRTGEADDLEPCGRCINDGKAKEGEPEESEESETCEVVKSDGEVCGRDLPCGYHSD